MAREGKKIVKEAEALLLERVGLGSGTAGDGNPEAGDLFGGTERITLEAVEALVAANREEPIYELTAALGRKNPRRDCAS